MTTRCQRLFLALVAAQAAHSLEEYRFRLYDVFAPARFISGLLSDNLTRGFAIANFLIFVFGIWCYFGRVRISHPSAAGFMWLWVVVETLNGLGHLAIALARGGYFPGLITAPLLLGLAVYLGAQLGQGTCQA